MIARVHAATATLLVAGAALVVAGTGLDRAPEPVTGTASSGARDDGSLRAPASFAHIEDARARSIAMFEEMGRVLQHPRCVNCHPATERPLQGEDGRPHEPLVVRGSRGFGVAGMTCRTCHMSENVPLPGGFNMPGNPRWHLAPAEAAWEGRSVGEICRQIKDPERNGGMDLEALVDHLAEDELVAWGWEPGDGREPAPGTQAELGELARAWVDAGAACPEG